MIILTSPTPIPSCLEYRKSSDTPTIFNEWINPNMYTPHIVYNIYDTQTKHFKYKKTCDLRSCIPSIRGMRESTKRKNHTKPIEKKSHPNTKKLCRKCVICCRKLEYTRLFDGVRSFFIFFLYKYMYMFYMFMRIYTGHKREKKRALSIACVQEQKKRWHTFFDRFFVCVFWLWFVARIVWGRSFFVVVFYIQCLGVFICGCVRRKLVVKQWCICLKREVKEYVSNNHANIKWAKSTGQLLIKKKEVISFYVNFFRNYS